MTDTKHFELSFSRSKPSFHRNEDGSALLERFAMFRVGTFTDALGREAKYTLNDLRDMVNNFTKLKELDVLPNVPVRKDHSKSVDSLVGYVDDIYVEGRTLYGDIQLTEPDAADKWERGTFRNRSSEIGSYVTNAAEKFDPVFMGVAFVDLPAVEGLYSLNRSASDSSTDQGDTHVFTQEDLDAARADGHKAGLAEGMKTAADAAPKPHSFSLHGAETTDAEAVAAHIESLEARVAEIDAAERVQFAKSLADEGKILASKLDEITETFAALDDNGFEAVKAVYALAEPHAAFDGASQDSKDETEDDGPKEKTEDQLAFEMAEAQVLEFRRMGLDEDHIEGTNAFKTLTALKAKEA